MGVKYKYIPLKYAREYIEPVIEPSQAYVKPEKTVSKLKVTRTGLSGVYKIECLTTKAVYIGQSKDLEGRLKTHRLNLRSGKHICGNLQQAFNLYGESDFLFESIFESDCQGLLDLETFYINEYTQNGYIIYNTVIQTNNTGLVSCSKENQAVLQKVSNLLDTGKITPDQLKNMVDSINSGYCGGY